MATIWYKYRALVDGLGPAKGEVVAFGAGDARTLDPAFWAFVPEESEIVLTPSEQAGTVPVAVAVYDPVADTIVTQDVATPVPVPTPRSPFDKTHFRPPVRTSRGGESADDGDALGTMALLYAGAKILGFL